MSADHLRENPRAHHDLLNKLTTSKAEFTCLIHGPTTTSQESAAVRKTTLASGAKALICRLRDNNIFFMCVLSSDRKVDWEKISSIVGHSATLADAERVNDLTGCIPGGVPPFGSIFNLPTYVDNSILAQESINFNAGLKTFSVLGLSVKKYLEIENPKVCDFSE
jgi:prolyl-tRNA editing enzyme YbaK/EbsC (Cys-tRNA(Pro) deacylase)